MRLDIPEGGYAKSRSGKKRGPLTRVECNAYVDQRGFYYLDGNGKSFYSCGRMKRDGIDRPEDLIAEWTEGPVRTVTRREVVEGRYACVDVGHVIDVPECENPDASPARKVAVALYGYRSSAELKAAAAVLLELAEAIEGDDK